MARADAGSVVEAKDETEKPVVPPIRVRSKFHPEGYVHLVVAHTRGYWVTPKPCNKGLAKDCAVEVEDQVSCRDGCKDYHG